MNSKSNGKLIAGLLIMFVVAISIVGVTYAYFVSDFTGNQKNTVAYVDHRGNINEDGRNVKVLTAVRPAMWINLVS